MRTGIAVRHAVERFRPVRGKIVIVVEIAGSKTAGVVETRPAVPLRVVARFVIVCTRTVKMTVLLIKLHGKASFAVKFPVIHLTVEGFLNQSGFS